MRQDPFNAEYLHLHERQPCNGLDEKYVRYTIPFECFRNEPAAGHPLTRNGLLQIPRLSYSFCQTRYNPPSMIFPSADGRYVPYREVFFPTSMMLSMSELCQASSLSLLMLKVTPKAPSTRAPWKTGTASDFSPRTISWLFIA